jgi:enoyl-CoA hydratase/carnithine racemase
MSPSTPPPKSDPLRLNLSTPDILLATLNTPKQLNCITLKAHSELDSILRRFDAAPSRTIAIFMGSGRAFSGGADPREWGTTAPEKRAVIPTNGFGGLSIRHSKKPIIAAMNGFSIGGATEMVVNCDMVVASSKAFLALPDVKVGLTGFGGMFPHLMHRIGRMERWTCVSSGAT